MNRQFHAKVSFGSYVLLAAMLSVAIYLIWQTAYLTKQWCGILITADLLIMVIIIERIINTTYTVTHDNRLVIHNGRFSKDIILSLDDIDRIDRINSMRIGGKALRTTLVIVMNDKTEHYIYPRNEEDFVQFLIKRKNKNKDYDDED